MNTRPMRRVLFALLIVGILGLAAMGGIQAGYSQGLIDGGNAEIVRTVPAYGTGGLLLIGGIVKAVLTVLIVGLIASLFVGRNRAASSAGRPHGHRGFGPGPWGPGGREEMRSRMEARLTEWHERAHQAGASTEDEDSES